MPRYIAVARFFWGTAGWAAPSNSPDVRNKHSQAGEQTLDTQSQKKSLVLPRLLALAAVLAAAASAFGDEATCRLDHTVVSYSGISREHAKAIARTVETARDLAVERFGFDMPETIRVNVTCDPKAAVRLFNDGQDRFSLTVRSQRDLRKPSTTGIFHLYGMCHEVGHLAMSRPISDHGWMTTAAAEGWAHYLGSRIVDGVYAREGRKLWPDAYDYRADGTKRLKRQLARKKQDPVTKGAGVWKELVEIVGDKNIAKIFKAWGQVAVDPADPGAAVRKALLAAHSDKRLPNWWDKAEPVFIFKRPESVFAARTAKPKELAARPVQLVHDDGTSAGKWSFSGGGHALRFKVDGPDWYLTEVKVFGSRYGRPQPPKEDFHLWLCDKDFKMIADFPFPYSKFAGGRATWVKLPIKPTNVPAEFIICVGFNPTGTKGIFVHHDKEGSGNSLGGLPGRGGRDFRQGDWLIRVSVRQLKAANSLKPGR